MKSRQGTRQCDGKQKPHGNELKLWNGGSRGGRTKQLYQEKDVMMNPASLQNSLSTFLPLAPSISKVGESCIQWKIRETTTPAMDYITGLIVTRNPGAKVTARNLKGLQININ